MTSPRKDKGHMAHPNNYTILVIAADFTQHIEAEIKCLAFFRDFQMHFLEQELLYFDENFIEISSPVSK